MLFNSKTKGKNTTTNYEGETAYTLSAAMELYTAVVTTSLADKFYEKGQERVARIRTLIAKNDPLFVAQLAVYAREKMYLRSIPLVLTVELAKVHKGDDLVGKLVNRIVQRADEITEILSYYALANERIGIKKLGKLSKQIQHGLATAFNKFDEYQFGKYNREAAVKLRDALFIVHPKAKDEAQQALFNKIVADELATPYTWETELSALGQTKFEDETARALAFQTKWEELIDSQKVGYMAMLRNLRNILQAHVGKVHIEKVANYLSNETAVLNSKQLPFRFLSAYRELEKEPSVHTVQLLNALEKAVKISVRNVQGFDENTSVLLACDVSGSMHSPISPKSTVQNYDIGLVLAMLLQNRCKAVTSGMFGDTWKVINVPQDNILANTMTFRKREGEVGYSTNGYLVIKDLITRKQVIDKVMMFTDCQMWNSNQTGETLPALWKAYKAIAPNSKLYLFDLAGYGQMPISMQGNDVFLIAGWSDKVFDVLRAIENGENALAEVQKTITL